MPQSILLSVDGDNSASSKGRNMNVTAVFPQMLQQTIHQNLPRDPKEVMEVLYTHTENCSSPLCQYIFRALVHLTQDVDSALSGNRSICSQVRGKSAQPKGAESRAAGQSHQRRGDLRVIILDTMKLYINYSVTHLIYILF